MIWNAFHDKLPDSNSNKITTELRGIMLQSLLYGQARDISRSISDSEIPSETVWKPIVDAFYKRDALTVVRKVYQHFRGLLSMKLGSYETFRNFESRFIAQVSKFNST